MAENPIIALLPSPLLGPAVWRPVQEALSTDGFDAVVPGCPDVGRSTVAEVYRWYLDDLSPNHDYVLVPHSNAGLYVPALSHRRSVVGLVFVDAVLPPPSGEVGVAPEGLLAMLGEVADSDENLPPWTSWWDDESVTELFPSPEVRALVEAEQPRFPMSYFRETVRVEHDWASVPATYVAFGDTYEPERSEANAWGWPTRVLEGNHLHMLVEPKQVANVIRRALA